MAVTGDISNVSYSRLHPYILTLVKWCATCLWETATVLLRRLLELPPAVPPFPPLPLPPVSALLRSTLQLRARRRVTHAPHISHAATVQCEVLHEPTEGAGVDVIFVHGLYGSLANTWRQGQWLMKHKSELNSIPLKRNTPTPETPCTCRKEIHFKEMKKPRNETACLCKDDSDEFKINEREYKHDKEGDIQNSRISQTDIEITGFINDENGNIEDMKVIKPKDKTFYMNAKTREGSFDETDNAENENLKNIIRSEIIKEDEDLNTNCEINDSIEATNTSNTDNKVEFKDISVIPDNTNNKDETAQTDNYIVNNVSDNYPDIIKDIFTKPNLESNVNSLSNINDNFELYSDNTKDIPKTETYDFNETFEDNSNETDDHTITTSTDDKIPETESIDENRMNKNCQIGCGCVCSACYSTCWPKDWLQVDYPDARIISINYTSDPYLWRPIWVQESKRLRLHERADQMAEQLLDLGVGSRPIVWVGHSKGGLFIKQMYCEGYEEFANGDNNKMASGKGLLWSRSAGFMFYSVPHRGSPLADINIPPFVARSIELLEMGKDCSDVLALQRRWLNAVDGACANDDGGGNARAPIVRSLVETCRTLMAVVWLRIVSVESADAGIGALCGVSVDHREICKPSSRRCLLYQELLHVIDGALSRNRQLDQETCTCHR